MRCEGMLSNTKTPVQCSKDALWQYTNPLFNNIKHVCGIHARSAELKGRYCTAIGAPKLSYRNRKEVL